MSWLIEKKIPEIGLYFRMKKYSEYVIEFEVKKLFLYDDGNGDEYKFCDEQMNFVHNPELTNNMIWGTIKWDGCSNVSFEDCVHGCSRSDMTRIGKAFDILFDMALELMPDNEEYLKD